MAGIAGAGYMMARPPLVEAGVTEILRSGIDPAACVRCAETGALSAGNCIDVIGPREGRNSMRPAELPR
jgi:hypothetical protein